MLQRGNKFFVYVLQRRRQYFVYALEELNSLCVTKKSILCVRVRGNQFCVRVTKKTVLCVRVTKRKSILCVRVTKRISICARYKTGS